MSDMVKELSLDLGRKQRESIDARKSVFSEQHLKWGNFGHFLVIPWLRDVHTLIIPQG